MNLFEDINQGRGKWTDRIFKRNWDPWELTVD